MTERKLEPWGGEVHLPGWVRRLRRSSDPGDTDEKVSEQHKGKAAPPGPSVLENADRVVWGGFRDLPK